MALSTASAKYGPLKLTLSNPTAAQATFLFATGVLVTVTLFLVAFYFFIQNVVALIDGAEPTWWHVMWATVTAIWMYTSVSD